MIMREDMTKRLNEWSSTDREIIDTLKNKGYKYLGNGVDQTAFLEPNTGLVLKIFGTQMHTRPHGDGRKKPVFSDDQLMFFRFAKFCQKNSNNPFLPKFSGFESFYFENKVYLQIRQERLRSCGDELGSFLETISEYVDILSFKDFCKRYKKSVKENTTRYNAWDDSDNTGYNSNTGRNNSNYSDFDDEEHDTYQSPGKQHLKGYWSEEQIFAKLLKDLGEDNFKLFYNTMKKLAKISESKGWTFDLHSGNFMLRENGWPVIVDPWVV